MAQPQAGRKVCPKPERRIPMVVGPWMWDYEDLYFDYYVGLSHAARWILIDLTLRANKGLVLLRPGERAEEGLARLSGGHVADVRAAVLELTEPPYEPLLAVEGDLARGLAIRPLWQPRMPWSQGWRAFRRAVFGRRDKWSCPRPLYRAVVARDGEVCRYCGASIPGQVTIDHVVPRAQAGRDIIDNLVVSCMACNVQKGSRTPGQAGMTLRAVEVPHA